MLTHGEIVEALRGAFPPAPGREGEGGVTLVARHVDPNLRLMGHGAHIFIPDCHLLSQADAADFPKNHFRLDDDFLAFLERLRDLKAANDADLEVWQLGDLFDIWRASGGEGAKEQVDRIVADYAPAIGLLRFSPPGGVGADILAGNHDYALCQLEEWRARRFRLLRNAEGADVLVLHGDAFSALEGTLPDEIQRFGVRFARWVSSGGHDLQQGVDSEVLELANRGLRAGDQPVGMAKAPVSTVVAQLSPNLPNSVNVIRGDEGDEEAENKKFYREARQLVEELNRLGHDISAVVIGHTHWARIVAGSRSDSAPLVLFDCGAWFGQSRLEAGGPWIWSAQMGVLIENDFRLYQLGWRPAGD